MANRSGAVGAWGDLWQTGAGDGGEVGDERAEEDAAQLKVFKHDSIALEASQDKAQGTAVWRGPWVG
jgi:hypothetical protein